jgi:hypothetical protein
MKSYDWVEPWRDALLIVLIAALAMMVVLAFTPMIAGIR